MTMTLLTLAVLTALGTGVFVGATNNLQNAQRDRQATAALADSEAGVAQALSYIKTNGVGGLRCWPSCLSNPWGNTTTPYSFTLATGERYEVSIEPVQRLNEPPGTTGLYRITSVGRSGTAAGMRTVKVDVHVAPLKFPLGVFAHTVQAGGSGAIFNESLFSTGCVFRRDKIAFSGIDQIYKIPAAAHSSQYITDSQGSGTSCPESDNKNIHKTGPCSSTPAYKYDQDRQGGPLNGTTCHKAYAGTYPETSKIESDDHLAELYDYEPQGLTSGQLDLLRTAAQEQGFYFENTPAIPAVLKTDAGAAPYPNPVLFYDLKGAAVGGLVDLKDLAPLYFGRSTPLAADQGGCHGRNVVVVVLNGNVRMNSGTTMVGSIFALGPDPYGVVSKANGSSTIIGTIFARQLDLTGTASIYMDDCFLANLPGSLLTVTPDNFREVDR